MSKNKIPTKLIAVTCILLFIGILVIQSTGCFNKELSNQISTKSNNLPLKSEYDQNKLKDNQKQNTYDENDNIDESSKKTISDFIDKTKQRYPKITKIGKDMGFNKKSILNIIEKLNCEKTVKTYISFFGNIFNI